MKSPVVCSWLVAVITLMAPCGVPAQTDAGAADSATADEFEDVYFSSEESELTDDAKDRLDRAAETLNELITKFPNLQIELLGYADWTASDGYNLALSEQRANVVKAYLIDQAVPADRISTYAYGEFQAIAANGIDEERAANGPEMDALGGNAQPYEDFNGESDQSTTASASLGAVSSLSSMASRIAR